MQRAPRRPGTSSARPSESRCSARFETETTWTLVPKRERNRGMSNSERNHETDPISSEPSLARREWLTAFAAGGIATVTAALPRYASSQRRARPADSPELELRYIKEAVEPLKTRNYVEEAKREGIVDGGINGQLAADINQFLGTTYQAFVYSELVNALPDDVRSTKEVQADVATMSSVLDQAVADAYFIIGTADAELKKDIDRELQQKPDLLMDMAAGLDEEGGRHGMGIHGRVRLRRASSQLSARLRMQSSNEVMTDLNDKITRISERNGVSRRDGEQFEVSLATRRMMSFVADDPSMPDSVETSPASPTESSSAGKGRRRDDLQWLERKARRLTRASRGLAGTGGGLLIAGGIAFGVSGGLGGAFVMCLGGLALLLALFIVGAAARRRKQLEEAKAAAKYNTDR